MAVLISVAIFMALIKEHMTREGEREREGEIGLELNSFCCALVKLLSGVENNLFTRCLLSQEIFYI